MRMLSIAKTIRVQKLQDKNRMVGKTFSVIGGNQRREIPWLGSVWFQPGMEQERKEFISNWKEETKTMIAKHRENGRSVIF